VALHCRCCVAVRRTRQRRCAVPITQGVFIYIGGAYQCLQWWPTREHTPCQFPMAGKTPRWSLRPTWTPVICHLPNLGNKGVAPVSHATTVRMHIAMCMLNHSTLLVHITTKNSRRVGGSQVPRAFTVMPIGTQEGIPFPVKGQRQGTCPMNIREGHEDPARESFD
jgi:hypothetical protein